jgi:hypothetical protein
LRVTDLNNCLAWDYFFTLAGKNLNINLDPGFTALINGHLALTDAFGQRVIQ